ncbi:MAG: hypothetical protein JW786_08920 [Desulfobacterales bacterium]|nr:hypothetical protein [Desulfobacterales bacterium]
MATMLTCPLCAKEVSEFHKRSHLLPEWMYTECYDQKHKLLEVSRADQKLAKKQKGFYGSFMCSECERETQKFDHYASLILTTRSPNSPEYRAVRKECFSEYHRGARHDFSRWENLDFKKFQQFVFAIILRTHFAGKMDGVLSLSTKHLNAILNIYRDNSRIDDYSYPILLTEYPSDDKLRSHIVMPFINKKGGHHTVDFAGAGYLFQVYVSSHSKPRFAESLRLKADGSVFVINMFLKEMGLYKNVVELVHAAKNTSKFT